MNFSVLKRILRAPYGVSLCLCILLQGTLMAVVNPLLPVLISNRIGLDKSHVALFFLINTLVGIVVTLSTGYLSDGTVARYKLVLLGGTLATLGYLGIATATLSMHIFIAGPFMVALGVLFPQLFAVAKDGILSGWEREAQVMGITTLRTLFSFGFIFGTGLSSGLIGIIDVQTIFVLVAVAVLCLTLFGATVVARLEKFIAAQSLTVAKSGNALPANRRGIQLPIYAMVVPLLALVVLTGADGTRGAYLSLAMFQLFGDPSIAPLMFGIGAAVELITMGVMGYLSSKIKEKYVIAIGALFGAVYFVILSSSQALPLLYGAQVIYAVFVAALMGVAMAYVQGMLAHRVGMGGSLYMAVLNCGSLVGILSPLLVTGYSQTIFIIPAVLCIAGAALLLVGDRTTQIEQRLRASAALRAASAPELVVQDALLPSVMPQVAEVDG